MYKVMCIKVQAIDALRQSLVAGQPAEDFKLSPSVVKSEGPLSK